MRKGLILQNGRIYTMNPEQPVVEAVVLRGPRVAYAGTTEEMAVWAGHGGWETIDLQGRTVLPGFTDSHIHLSGYAISRSRLEMAGMKSLEEALAAVARQVRQTPPGRWILGRGWNHNLWGGKWPTRQDLDSVAPANPVALERQDGHSTWVNTAALKIAGIEAETHAPSGGEIVVDEEGRPTGIIKETAMDLILQRIDRPDQEERLRLLQLAFAEAHRYGFTGVHAPEDAQAFNDYQAMLARGALRLRILFHLPQNELDQAIAMGIRSGFGNEWLRVGGIKIFSDGSLGSKTASLLQDYEDEPGYRGLPTLSVRDLDDLVFRATKADLSVAIHAIGDRAIRLSLDAIALAQREAGRPPIPHSIEHVQLLHPQELPRFYELGVVASMQPIHCPSDMTVAQRLWGDRCRYSYAWRSVLDHGAVLAFGSDSPVESMSPWEGIHAAMTRQRTDGTPPGGWYPEQCITAEQAVWAYTMGGAVAAGESQDKGSIEEGKVADLIVLDRDVLHIPAQEVLETKVEMTVLGGEVVWGG